MSEPFDLAGMTVEDARRLLQRPYNIAPQALVTVKYRGFFRNQFQLDLKAVSHRPQAVGVSLNNGLPAVEKYPYPFRIE